ncbi:YggT family protein [Latilactobacillus curvatus]|uniref:YggT family protein n=1 Tax=Latilactobacillus curvatus TaxID=28038 RepID=UPI002410C993|nr:YggT family protein [Latilactobacillus curvatus]
MQLFLFYVLLMLMYVVRIYSGIVVIYCLLTWIPEAMSSKLGRFVAKLVEPFLEIFDRFIPAIGGIGISAIAAFFVLYLVERGIGLLAQLLVGM